MRNSGGFTLLRNDYMCVGFYNSQWILTCVSQQCYKMVRKDLIIHIQCWRKIHRWPISASNLYSWKVLEVGLQTRSCLWLVLFIKFSGVMIKNTSWVFLSLLIPLPAFLPPFCSPCLPGSASLNICKISLPRLFS